MRTFPQRVDLRPDEVHVVRIALDTPRARAFTLLDEHERARAAKFLLDRDRRRFIAAHGALRVVIGRVRDADPASLVFTAGIHGKPALAAPGSPLRFNLSHGGERALVAVTRGREVGVDIEEERDVEELALARRFFSAAESHALESLGPAERRSAFFRVWTRKESFIKALGDGLSFPLADFDVSLEQDASAQALCACRPAPLLAQWRVVPLAAEPGYAAAVAAEAGDWRVVCWDDI